MTVSTTARKTTPAVGNGSNKAWPFTFPVYNASDLKVYLVTVATGDVAQVLTDFSVSLNPDQEASPGGTITYPVVAAAITSAYKVQVVRDSPKTQATAFTFGGNFSEESVEAAMDVLATQLQEVSEAVSRAIQLRLSDTSGAATDLPTLIANYYLAVNSAGDGLTLAQNVDATTVTISSWIENNILNAANGAAVLAAIGGVGLSSNNVFTGKNDFQSTVALQKGANLTVADVAAGVLTLPDDGNFHDFTDGTNFAEITTLGGNARIQIHFSAGGNVLTHNATNLPLIGKANITTEANDVAEFTEYAAGDWRMTAYHRASGATVVPTVEDLTPVGTFEDLSIDCATGGVDTLTILCTRLILKNTALQSIAKSIGGGGLTPDITVSGANGLDTGSVTLNKWYSIWVIYNPTTDVSAGLFSTSFTNPTVPAGYTYKARVGFVITDGSSKLRPFYQKGKSVYPREVRLAKSGSFTTTGWANLSLSGMVPGIYFEEVWGLFGLDTTTPYPAVAAGYSALWGPVIPEVFCTTQAGGATTYGGFYASHTVYWSFTLRGIPNNQLYYFCNDASADLYITGWRYL